MIKYNIRILGLLLAGFVTGMIYCDFLNSGKIAVVLASSDSDGKMQPFARNLSIDGIVIEGEKYCIINTTLEKVRKYSQQNWRLERYEKNQKEGGVNENLNFTNQEMMKYKNADLSKIPRSLSRVFEGRDYYYIATEGLLSGPANHYVVTITFYENGIVPGQGVAICQNLGIGR